MYFEYEKRMSELFFQPVVDDDRSHWLHETLPLHLVVHRNDRHVKAGRRWIRQLKCRFEPGVEGVGAVNVLVLKFEDLAIAYRLLSARMQAVIDKTPAQQLYAYLPDDLPPISG